MRQAPDEYLRWSLLEPINDQINEIMHQEPPAPWEYEQLSHTEPSSPQSCCRVALMTATAAKVAKEVKGCLPNIEGQREAPVEDPVMQRRSWAPWPPAA
jgi:hypothetical protein